MGKLMDFKCFSDCKSIILVHRSAYRVGQEQLIKSEASLIQV